MTFALVRSHDPFNTLFGRMVALSAALHVAIFFAVVFVHRPAPKPLGFGFMEAVIVPGGGPVGKGNPEAAPAAAIEKKAEEKKEPAEDTQSKQKIPDIKREQSEDMTLPKDKTKVETRKYQKESTEPHTIESAIDKIRSKIDGPTGQPEGESGVSANYAGGGGLSNRIVALYLNKISVLIWKNWSLPSDIARDPKMHVKVQVRIDASGGLLERTIYKTSGISLVDESALNAVVKSAPFPPPPPLVASEMESEGIIFDFFPQETQ